MGCKFINRIASFVTENTNSCLDWMAFDSFNCMECFSNYHTSTSMLEFGISDSNSTVEIFITLQKDLIVVIKLSTEIIKVGFIVIGL